MRILRALFVLIFLCVAGAVAAAWWWNQQLNEQYPLTEKQRVLVIEPGSSMRSVSRDLEAEGILKHWWLLESWARIGAPGAVVRAGEYELPEVASVRSIFKVVSEGKPLLHQVTIPEGVTVKEFLALVQAQPLIKKTIDPGSIDAVLVALTGEVQPEGWLFPDTYSFQRGASDQDILRQANLRMRAELASAWGKRAKDIPLVTPYEALVLASIVEKETGAADERPMIAGVFSRRLVKGMRLQTDPTVIYGMGERYKGNIRKSDLREDTPYNTYVHAGLPPTPIALPGRDALIAAVQPADTKALYFVAKGGGRHHFSETYEEHKAAVIKYQLNGNASRYQGDR